MLEAGITTGDLITIVVFLITVGGLLYKQGQFSSAVSHRLTSLEERMDKKDRRDDKQDEEIAKVRQETMNSLGKIFTALGKLDERTKHIAEKVDKLA